MKAFLKGFLLLLFLAGIVGCSRKKNTFLNRNWHAVTTEYNTLYNGNLAFDLGREILNEAYVDDYWSILPVEPMQVRETVMAPGENLDPNFAIAESKAVKAIQRHSMLIEGSEKNPQIDEAYLLLGKARYYDQRFVPALEAFNYILHKYPLSNTITEAQIWREKTHMRLEFNELAIKNLKKILELDDLDKDDAAEASAALAQAYLNTGVRDTALVHIKRAAKLTDNKAEEGRYWFITGQLYDDLAKRDSANLAYARVIDLNRKTPRNYLINAQLRQIENSYSASGENAEMLERLLDMAEDRENRPYLDKIYFHLAEFFYDQDSVDLATTYYNRSLRVPSNNIYLQSLNYEVLGNINFDAANYEVAGTYYDSTLQKLAPTSREFRFIKKKRDNLEDVIYYENLAHSRDSVLYLASLPEEEQLEYFKVYTGELKEQALSAAAKPEQQAAAQNFFETKRPNMPGVPQPGSNFYFYNPTTVAYGKQEFARLWGNRELKDNWRTLRNAGMGEDLDVIGVSEAIANNPKYDPGTYIKKIPTDPAILDSLNQELNFANYQLGLIYRENFSENILAAQRLESLLDNKPAARLLLPAKYNLYKIYMDLGELARAQALKNDIVSQYPDSRYAAILQNPQSVLKDENNPTAQYEELYKKFEEQQFSQVIAEADNLILQYSGDEIVPKLELLKAMAEGRLHGFTAYKDALNYTALNYPQTEEGRRAQELLKSALPSMENAEFKEDSLATSFKLVFPFEKSNLQQAEVFTDEIKTLTEDRRDLKVSLDVYNNEQVFVVVHGFSSSQYATAFTMKDTEDGKNRFDRKSFYISSNNYRTAQIHKNIAQYLSFKNELSR